MPIERKKFELRVAEAMPKDVGQDYIRIDPNILKQLGLKMGDVVEITFFKMKTRTAAIVWSSYPEDKGKLIIRMDESTRNKLNAELDDILQIKKIEVVPAESVWLTPINPNVEVINEQLFPHWLENRVVMKGDIINLIINDTPFNFQVDSFTPFVNVVMVNKETIIQLKKHTPNSISINSGAESKDAQLDGIKKFAVLQIKECMRSDLGLGIASLDSDVISKLKLTKGDVICIENMNIKNKTAAVVWTSYPQDKGSRSIRIDGTTRNNLRGKLTEKVRVYKITPTIAQTLILAPVRSDLQIENEQSFITLLVNRVFMQGETIPFLVRGVDYIEFMVIDFTPKGKVVAVVPETKIECNPGPAIALIYKRKVQSRMMGFLQEFLNQWDELPSEDRQNARDEFIEKSCKRFLDRELSEKEF
ncbi:MAG TPA: hypothetical protein VKK79_22495 [Candidatus Lokiarchaeia archaeon]|nr:hypothetical protein [Candidatus Lokiarchaeia archaeon]